LLPQTPTPSRAVCAANLADKYSIAGAVGTIGKQGFFANVFNGFAGNTFSGVTLAFSGGGNKYRLGTSINNATFGGTASAINAVTTPAPITELTETSAANSWAKVSAESKVSEEEYARLEAMAGGRAMSEWVREVLLRELDGGQARPAEQTVLAEVLALWTILLNLHFAVAKGETITAENMQAMIDRADAIKMRKAAERLKTKPGS
jgi:hypothetical protein